MLNELLTYASKEKNSLLSQFDNYYNGILPESIISKWNNYEFKNNKIRKSILAVDGSINQENLISQTVYALSSHAVYSPVEPGTQSISQNNKLELMPPSNENYNQIFSKQMNLFELKTILNSLHEKPEVDYLLLDGDFFSILNHVSSIVNTSLRKNNFIKEYTKRIVKKEKNNYSKEVLSVQSIIDDIPDNLNVPIGEVVLYIQMVEQLCVLKNIMEKYSKKIVSISKTSRTRNLYDNRYFSDLSLIDYYCTKQGYSDATVIDDTRSRRFINNTIQYGQYAVYNDFFNNLTYTNRFVKFYDKGSVLKVQLSYAATEEEFLDVLEDLHSFCIDKTGYPFLLKKAHDDVKITSRDMNVILKKLGLNFDNKERDML